MAIPAGNIFFIWWIFTCISVCFPLGLFDANIMQPFYEVDSTGLSFLILIIYFYNSFRCGGIFWSLNVADTSDYDSLCLIKTKVQKGWFYSDVVLSVGMLGTVIGFIMMLSGLSGLDPSDINSAQNVIKDLGTGMATALWTTLFGLVASILLKVQVFKAEEMVNQKILL